MPPQGIFPWSLAYEEYRLQVIHFDLELVIYPFTRSDDLMILIQPLIDSINPFPVSPINKILYVTTMALPSVDPQFAMITVLEETVLDRLLTGLTDGMLDDVQLELECLDPDATLLLTIRQPNYGVDCTLRGD